MHKQHYVVSPIATSRHYARFDDVYEALRHLPEVRVRKVAMHHCHLEADEREAAQLAVRLGRHYRLACAS